MEQELTTLKATLANTFNQFSGPLMTELSQSLHTDEKNQLPHQQLSELAAETVDLLHSIEQLLTPPPLIVADHFLGKNPPQAPHENKRERVEAWMWKDFFPYPGPGSC